MPLLGTFGKGILDLWAVTKERGVEPEVRTEGRGGGCLHRRGRWRDIGKRTQWASFSVENIPLEPDPTDEAPSV